MADRRPAWFVLGLMLATAAAAQDSRTSSLPDQLTQHEQKLSQARAARNLKEETTELVSLGSLQLQAGQTQKAKDYFNQALQIWRKVGNRNGEALALNDIGRAYGDLRHPQEALEFFNQALPLWREAGNRRGEALTLNNIGRVYSDLGQEQHALENLNQALPIWREVGNHHGEASTLNAMGRVYSDMGQEQKAMELFNQALPYWREAADRNGEALTLDNLGRVYAALGQGQKAIEFYNQALPIWRATGNRHGEASTLNSIGRAYADMGQLQNGLEFYNQALPAWRDVGDRSGVALTLNNIGRVYADQGQKQKALELYYQVLPIWREVENPRGEAGTLTNIGLVYDNQAQPQKVLPNELAALSLAKSAGDLDLQGRIEASLMRYFRGQQRPEVAIFFGTGAVNCFQQMRRNISGLEKDLQSGFAQSKSATYRQLAELLVQTDRLGEAEQVLDLLKEQELKEVVRGANGDPTSKTIALTPDQQKAQSELDNPEKAAVTLAALNMEYAELQAKASRTPAEEARMKELDARIEAGNGEVSAFFRNTLYTQLAHKAGTEDANALLSREKSDVSQLQNTLAELGPGVLGIRVLLGEEHVYAIVVTPHTREKVELKATPAELRSKVLQVRDDLRTPTSDPKPHLAQLYAMVVSPLVPQLTALQAGHDRVPTLLWSLDGVLRYLPMAALYDGKQYMAERFNNVLFTPESYGHMAAASTPGLRVLAMGLTKSYGGLPALPGVMPELEAVVRDPAVPQSHGPMDGKLLPDEQFTLAALKTQLGASFPVVHIASHFVVESGSGEEPYLMLGGENVGGAEGYALTLSRIEDSTITFRGTQLLTLSACSTAKGDAAKDGLEMDSLGMIAQQKDAAAVLATLWDVNDASTSRLMSDFYARWVKLPAGGKAEALRQAQLALLHGSGSTSKADRGSKIEQEPNTAGYAHPFYWAPFVLIGNFQ
jgi:CHAT domain-containing protein/Tfp pilus assembly protein PilF